MENQKFYLYIVSALISAALTAFFLNSGLEYKGIAAAVTSLAALKLVQNADREASRQGRTRKIKVSTSVVKPLYEIIILYAALTSAAVSKELAVAVLGSVLLIQLIRSELVNQLRQTVRPQIGQDIRISVAAATYIMSTINPFYIFYGMAIVGFLAAYDLVDLLYRSLNQR